MHRSSHLQNKNGEWEIKHVDLTIVSQIPYKGV